MRPKAYSLACAGLSLILMLSLAGAALANPGDLDSTFDGDGYLFANLSTSATRVNEVEIDSAGRIVAVGTVQVGYNTNLLVARFTPDGQLDPSFHSQGYVTTDFIGGSETAWDLVLQPDGKIVAAGDAGGDFAVARYHPDGSLDHSFSADGLMTIGFGSSESARAIAISTDGRIILAGQANNDLVLARLLPDGSLDPTFDGDGMLVLDFGSDASGGASSLAIQADGKIISAGSGWDGGYRLILARFNPDGSLDGSFGAGGMVATGCDSFCDLQEVLVQPDGKIVGVGFENGVSVRGFVLRRYHADGDLDVSFGAGGIVQTQPDGNPGWAFDAALLPDDKILAVGYAELDTGYGFALARYNPDGSLDVSFNGDGVVITPKNSGYLAAYSVAIDGSGQAVAGGVGGLLASYVDQLALASYLPDGSLNDAFGEGGIVMAEMGKGQDYARSVALQPDGKIIAAGESAGVVTLARYLSEGSLDSQFGDGGVVFDSLFDERMTMQEALLQRDGKILILGRGEYSQSLFLARYGPDGSLDLGFGMDGKVELLIQDAVGEALALQADGKIVVAGNLRSTSFVARFNENGSLDPTFSGDGWVSFHYASFNFVQSVAVQPDGKIVLARSEAAADGSNRDIYLARLDPDGNLDSMFSGDGVVRVDVSGMENEDYADDLALQPDGKILVAGHSWDTLAGSSDLMVARFTPNGALDPSFDGDGVALVDFIGGYDQSTAVEFQADGKIVVVGESDDLLAVARLHSNGSLDPTFGEDGKIRLELIPAIQLMAGGAMLQPTDGKIVVAGSGLIVDEGGQWDFVLARIQTASEGTATLNDGETGVMGETGAAIRLNSGGPCTFTVMKVPVPPGGSPGSWGELPVHWEIGSSCTTLDYDLILSYTEDELAQAKGALEDFLRPVSSADGGLTWSIEAGELDPVANSMTVDGVTTTGQWGLVTQAPFMFWLPVLLRLD